MKRLIFFLFLISQFSFLNSQNLTGVKIFINPGHGGFDSDDRNVVIAPYTSGDSKGFWESQSNLDKGFALRSMLQSAGATVGMSRTTNTTADDLPLSQIVTMGNTMQSDFFLSIHSNAGNGVASYVLMIHYGSDLSDSQIYPSYNPGNATQLALSNKSKSISTEIAKNLYANQITTWSSGYQVRGDKTFARTIMSWSDGYGVLRGLAVPGVISEGAMHDYIPETYRLMNMEYKWLEAWNFYKSFCNYFNGGQISTGVIAGQVRDSRIKNEATYNKFAGNDQMLPLNGAKLTLVETNETYTVDNMQNGVFVFKNLTPGAYHVKAEKDGYYAQTVEITVTAHNIAYKNFALNRVRTTPPQVLSYTPNVVLTDSVEASTSISMQFNWDMDIASTEQAFSISPTVAGKFTWEDTNYRMRFTPDKPLEKNTVYTVTLNKSASHPDNLSMVTDFSFQFRTKSRNRLSLIAMYPFDGANKVYFNNPSFRLIFDKKLNTANLATAIRVLDETNTVLAKATRSVVNNSAVSPYGSTYFNLAANLIPNKEYSLVIDGDVVDDVGMKVVEPISIKFKASNTLVTTQPIVETFETTALAYDATQSTGISSASATTNATKLFGTYSNQLTAGFSGVNSSARLAFTNPVNFMSGQFVGLHLFGDLSGNSISLEIQNGSEISQLPLCDLNFYGWEFHEAIFPFIGAGGNLKVIGIRVNYTNRFTFSNNSTILLDNMLLYNTAILSTNKLYSDVVKVYPNPVSDFINVTVKNANSPFLQLYSISGVLIKEIRGNKLTVSDIATGTYILKVKFGNSNLSYPIFIVR
ncbi:MAG: Ig-like domain-containing protein [Paludibacter sp.]